MRLLPVSKGVPAERLRAALELGLGDLAENRVQEADAKATALPGITWHLVGQLQANKARRALRLFACIQSVDSFELAERLDRLARERGTAAHVLLEVNVDDDAAKTGFRSSELDGAAVERLHRLGGLQVDGLMTVGRLVESPAGARSTFVALRELQDRLLEVRAPVGGELSMGMSDDFEVAIEEGATIVRVGRAIFGERPTA